VAVTSSYPAEELAGAELVVNGLGALTLPVLDALCANQELKNEELRTKN
jgi:hypothetical protein